MKAGLHRILSGFIRMHILHHAAEHPVHGNWMLGELREHGYKLSPGTLYPMLHGMVRDGLLEEAGAGDSGRKRPYRITPEGLTALAEARTRLRELFREVEDPKGKAEG